MMSNPQYLKEVVGENVKPPKVELNTDVKKLVEAGLISEKDAKKVLSEGKSPRLLLEG